ncbi:hypothetical protein [Chitinophaga sp. CF418]|uniref:hypothetical protein n=1 Tax=Chitinophaga sp. CF418 TaxID=1855287 RepID=UPI000915ED07|nr:hypothetical protein [Chitinophaga sp. CF418]SHL87488.1 hypothetical protein SAMN05216311_1014 [Chitinophaga sp. CF418]
MKALTTFLVLFFSVNGVFAQQYVVSEVSPQRSGSGDTLLPGERTTISFPIAFRPGSLKGDDRHFFVTFIYNDGGGCLKKSWFGFKSNKTYPRQSDLICEAANITHRTPGDVYIVGVDSICKADFEELTKK